MVDRLRRCDYERTPVEQGPTEFDGFDGPLLRLPRHLPDVIKMFGDPGVGRGRIDPAWERQHMVLAKSLPTPRGKLYIHRLAEPYLREALRRANRVAPGEVRKIGAFNFRRMRHRADMPLSLHAWGIAVDVNPRDNAATVFGKHRRPDAFSTPWREQWPNGLTRAFVAAWESVGWTWGGRWTTLVDPMHFELTSAE